MNKNLDHLFKNNRDWSDSIKQDKPNFFSDLAEHQTPEVLWIGCADSRIPVSQIVDVLPGEIFVHRNIANMVVHTDLNSLSVIQYAVDVLKVSHIVVCGHYGCGGVNASMTDDSYGIIDNWLRHIKDVSRFNHIELDKLEGEEKFNRLCELNVAEQVKNVAGTAMVKDAWKREQPLTIHGWIYGLKDGLVKDLEVTLSSSEDLK